MSSASGPIPTPMAASRRGLLHHWFGSWLLQAIVAAALIWPVLPHSTTKIPQGMESVATVPLLNAWTVWWNARSAQAGYRAYWDAPIFYPAQGTFSYSEAQPTTVLVAPVLWCGGSIALAYNLYLLLSLFLNGVLMQRLLRSEGFLPPIALATGLLAQLLPFVSWQLGVLQLTLLWPSLWTVTAGLQFVRQPGWLKAVELGLAFSVTYASCNYYGLFLSVLLPPAAIWFLNARWRSVRSWGQLLLALGVSGALLAPLVSQQRSQSRQHTWERDEATVLSLSAHTEDYLDTPSVQWLEAWEGDSPRRNLWTLGPGLLKLLWAGVGLCLGLLNPALRRWTLFATTFAILGWMYSLGPGGDLWGLCPYDGLRQYLPGFAQIRSPFRFAMFVQLGVLWLGAAGLQTLSQWATHPDLSRRWRSLAGGVALGVTVACLLETIPAEPRTHTLEVSRPLPLWVEYLRDELPPRSVVACLPFSFGPNVEDYEVEARWMLWSTQHGHTLLNGYSGYFPDGYVALKTELLQFPDDGVTRLQQMGAEYVVVEQDFESEAVIRQHPATRAWEWIFSDEQAGVDVYRLPQ